MQNAIEAYPIDKFHETKTDSCNTSKFKIRNFVQPFRLDLLLKTKQSNDSIKLCSTWNLITIVSTITFETRVNFSVVYVICVI